jgi:hypothetical protein
LFHEEEESSQKFGGFSSGAAKPLCAWQSHWSRAVRLTASSEREFECGDDHHIIFRTATVLMQSSSEYRPLVPEINRKEANDPGIHV